MPWFTSWKGQASTARITVRAELYISPSMMIGGLFVGGVGFCVFWKKFVVK